MVISGVNQGGPGVHDAVSALISLGFAEKESRDAVNASALTLNLRRYRT